jgi:hypothetical protein
MGSHHLPIYRMADGEFRFLLGTDNPRNPFSYLRAFAKLLLRGYRTCWGETYNVADYIKARRIVKKAISHISRYGILAPYFAVREDGWGERFFLPMCNWFAKHSISLNEENFVPFYFVYALLNTLQPELLYSGKHIVVVTGTDDSRCTAIRDGLASLGALSVEFVPVSRSKTVFDRVDASAIRTKPDLVLVAAGIGSAVIIQQLKDVQAPCIDCGICIECLIEPTMRTERPFLALAQ